MTVAVSLALLAFLVAGSTCHAQTKPADAPKSKSGDAQQKQKTLKQILERLEKVERELRQLKAKDNGTNIPAKKSDQRIVALLETPFLGATYYGSSGVRYFAARLIFANLTSKAVTLTREHIQLDADGKLYKLEDVPSQIQGYSFQVGNQSYQLRNLKPAKQIKLSAGGTASTWVVFASLPQGNQVPKLTLKLKFGDKLQQLNVNQFASRQLGLTVKRLGPRDCLALLTISGKLNTINIGSFADELDRLAAQKVARVVVHWGESAATVDSNTLSWLQQVASQAGRGTVTNVQYPTVPATIRELHLAEIPGRAASSYSSSRGPVRIHKTSVEAVTAALRTAYETLPRDELLEEIQQGPLTTRAAALAAGGGRLANDRLPLILKYADDNEPKIQRSALIALRHFGDKQAIQKLVHYVRKNSEPLALTAVESLAGSRYAAAHTALLGVLKDEDVESKKKIVQVLARYPRPIWSETIYEFATKTGQPVSAEALRALVRIGHPKMFEVLQQALTKGNAALKLAAFNELVTRTDERSEQMAMDYALKYLEKSAPTSQIRTLLTRTKDKRAVPLLLKHLSRSSGSRQTIISTLAQIGDQTVGDALAKKYPSLRNYDQAAVLRALSQMNSPVFLKLAKTALNSGDSYVVNAACQGLRTSATPAAGRMLIETLAKSSNSSTVSAVCNALSYLATPDARAALLKARDSGDSTKHNYAKRSLRYLQQRSPGYQYVYQGRSAFRQNDWKTAIEQYTVAIKIDSDLPDAYVGRANSNLRLNKVAEAKKDFRKTYELDPYNSQAATGLAVIMVLEGEFEVGIKFVEDQRKKFPNDNLFAYNAACVYGRAIEQLKKDKQIAGRDKKIQAYTQKAIADLQLAVKKGFRDFTWMKKDPDLKELRALPEFKKLMTPKAKKAKALPANVQRAVPGF